MSIVSPSAKPSMAPWNVAPGSTVSVLAALPNCRAKPPLPAGPPEAPPEIKPDVVSAPPLR